MEPFESYSFKNDALIKSIEARIHDKKVTEAMARVPRHLFVDSEQHPLAYEDAPLSIGCGQTISQPYIVALMTSALDLTGKEKVLDVGTGSGYQAAILAELSDTVITVERIPELSQKAASVLNSLGYTNVKVEIAGNKLGYPEEAPYDAILVAAGAPEIPGSLVAQLNTGGRLVIPIGNRLQQELIKVKKMENDIETKKLGGCRFVSLISNEAWSEE